MTLSFWILVTYICIWLRFQRQQNGSVIKIDQTLFNFFVHMKSLFLISGKAWKRKKRIERRKKALKPLSTEPPPPTMNPYRLEFLKFSKFFNTSLEKIRKNTKVNTVSIVFENLEKTCALNWITSWDDSSGIFWRTRRPNNDYQTTDQTYQQDRWTILKDISNIYRVP